MSAPWYRMDATFLSDPRVVQATSEQGPRAIAAYMFVIATAKLANQKGRVEVAPFVMARDTGMTVEEAKATTYTLVTVGLIQITEESIDVYQVPNWSIYQPDKRDHEARAQARAEHPGRRPGRPRKNGAERSEMGGKGIRDGTSRDEKKNTARDDKRRPTAVITPADDAQRDRNRRMAVVAAEAHRTGQLGHVSAALTAAGTDNPDAARAALEAAS